MPRPGRAGPVPDVPGFELGELLARGATSEVWAGVAVDGGRRVAVKVVSAALAPLEAAAREAAVSSSAASAHVVGVEACVPLPDGRVALVMPHLRGGSLGGLVRARGHLVPGEVVTVLAPVASALGRLHDVGVVHGDVSPGNVLLDLDGRPLLGDLGLGHVVGDVSPGVWGTEGYVAPEVLMGAEPTPASDVYGVGALGWLCVSGQVPGAPGLRPALADVSRTGPEGAALLGVLDAAVAPDPGDRPSAHELAWQLFSAADPEPLQLVRGDDDVSVVTYRLRAAAERGRAVARGPAAQGAARSGGHPARPDAGTPRRARPSPARPPPSCCWPRSFSRWRRLAVAVTWRRPSRRVDRPRSSPRPGRVRARVCPPAGGPPTRARIPAPRTTGPRSCSRCSPTPGRRRGARRPPPCSTPPWHRALPPPAGMPSPSPTSCAPGCATRACATPSTRCRSCPPPRGRREFGRGSGPAPTPSSDPRGPRGDRPPPVRSSSSMLVRTDAGWRISDVRTGP